MNPKIFKTEYFFLDPYSFFFIVACFIGFSIFLYEVKRRKWDIEDMLAVAAGCMLGAFLGMIFLTLVIFGHDELITRISELDFSGMSVLGGISGGFIGVEITKKIIGYSQPTGDAFAVAIPFAHAIGRLGCYFVGCCYGTICNLPWALEYPSMSPAYLDHLKQGLITIENTLSLPVHPIPIYEILFNFMLFAFILKIRDRFIAIGSLFRVYLILFCLFRFFEEFIRSGTGEPIFIGLKFVQIYLLVGIVYFTKWLYINEFRLKTNFSI